MKGSSHATQVSSRVPPTGDLARSVRTGVTKSPGSPAAELAMAFKLLASAQDRWRLVNGPQLVAFVRAGAKLQKGVSIQSSLQAEQVAP
jgi:hypothetical protein